MSKIKQIFFSFLILGLMSGFIFHSSVSAQIDATVPYWQIMPPYNVLWPLWVGALSPAGVPALDTLDTNTVLPIQPVWVWNDTLDYPWFIYDFAPGLAGGLYYYDLFYGFKPFDSTLTALSPLNYEALIPPWGAIDFATWANQSTILFDNFWTNVGYPSILTQLVTPASLWPYPVTFLPLPL